MIGWFLNNLMGIKRDCGLCTFAQSILPGFNEFGASLVSICLYFGFTGLLIPENILILRTHFQFDSPRTPRTRTSRISHGQQKEEQKRALGPASASVTNAKATLPPETIAAITSHPMRTYGRKLAHKV